MSDPRQLRLVVIAYKEDNPWLPDNAAVRRGVVDCGSVEDWPTIDEMVDLELRSAGRAMLALLRREGLIPERPR